LSKIEMSSGDLRADRRLAFAEGLLAGGEAAAAAELMAQTMGLVPEWAAGWLRLGEMAEAAGQTPLAIEAYQRASELDPADALGAALRRDLLRKVPVIERMSSAYVEGLFDDYAHRFDQSLVGKLGYRGPEIVARCLPGRLGRVLDLGCGTGLMGAAIRDRALFLEGWDISSAMLRQAKAKKVYDHLDKRDLNTLEIGEARWDTILAADVVIYIGALERLVGWVAGSLAPGGIFAFTVESFSGEGFALGEARRYAHSESYLRQLLDQAGFTAVTIRRDTLRTDRGQPVEALVVSAKAPALKLGRTGEEAEVA
jgi:predicted TPR repeat methyltransferase